MHRPYHGATEACAAAASAPVAPLPTPPPPSPPPRPTFVDDAAAAAAAAAAIGVPTAAAPSHRAGLVPGRPVLEVPGWADSSSNSTRSSSAGASSPSRRSGAYTGAYTAPPPAPAAPATRLRIFSGTSNPALAAEVASYLGMDLGQIKIKRFADGETYVQVCESVRGADVFLVQPTSPPVNDHFMELAVMIDACRRASARSITAVIPYYGYARADRKTQGRESIAAKLTANLLTEAGADRVLAMDLHSGQTVGYFDIPVDHVYGEAVILSYLASKRAAGGDLVVVSPDVGGVARARAFAKKLNDAPLAIVDKRRSAHNVSEVMNLIGDVKGKVAVLVDDMIDTAGTITNAAKVLRQEGARAVYACATHAVFSPPAVERLSSGVFEEVIVTNTIAMPPERVFPQLTVLSVANLLGETIWRVHSSTSVQALRD